MALDPPPLPPEFPVPPPESPPSVYPMPPVAVARIVGAACPPCPTVTATVPTPCSAATDDGELGGPVRRNGDRWRDDTWSCGVDQRSTRSGRWIGEAVEDHRSGPRCTNRSAEHPSTLAKFPPADPRWLAGQLGVGVGSLVGHISILLAVGEILRPYLTFDEQDSFRMMTSDTHEAHRTTRHSGYEASQRIRNRLQDPSAGSRPSALDANSDAKAKTATGPGSK